MPFFSRLSAAFESALELHFLRFRVMWILAGLGVLLLALIYWLCFSAPSSYPVNSLVSVPRGESAREIASGLENEHVVRSAVLLRVLLRLSGGSAHVHPGAYRLTAPENVFTIAWRLETGAFGIPSTRLTFVEGTTVRDMAGQVEDAFPAISASDFIATAGPYEGYLFPDTYLFPPDASAASIVGTLRENFDAKTAPLADAIAASGHSESDIVIMASLVEREANTPDARRMVAGILWNRVRNGMPLQVDAVFGYIFGRDTYSPSFADLSVDSLYNTYTHKGLPPGPIDNPGLDSLTAATEPAQTDDLFYLTGKDGQMYYAKTYREQLANQHKYLR